MAGTRHRLQGHHPLAVVHPEHVFAELVPVSAPDPELLRHQLRRPHFRIAGLAHLAADVVLQHPVHGVAARMPEHHAGSIVLEVPEVELDAEVSVVEIFHGLHSLGSEKRADGDGLKIGKAPSVAGGAFLVKLGFLSPYDQKASRRKRSPWWSMLLIEASSCSVYGGKALRRQRPPGHSMTSSAVASSAGGTVRPKALAVFRLMTSLKRVGCSMGRSPGFAPFNILST